MKTNSFWSILFTVIFIICMVQYESRGQCRCSPQDTTYCNIITIDGCCDINQSLFEINNDNPVIIRIRGFNPLLYNVQVNTKDSAQSIGEVPKMLSAIGVDFLKWYALLPGNVLSSAKIEVVQSLSDTMKFEIDGNMIDQSELFEINNQLADAIDIILTEVNRFLFGVQNMYGSWYYDSSLRIDSNFIFRYDSSRQYIEEGYIILNEINKIAKDPKITENLAHYRTLLDSLDKKFDANKFYTVLTDYRNYISCDSYYSFPFFLNDDAKEVNISVTPYSTDTKAPYYGTSFFLKRKKAFYFGFSSGFFISDVRPHLYSAKTTIQGGSTLYSPVMEDISDVQLGLQAMVNAGLSFDKWGAVHLGIGPTLGFQDKIIPGLAIGGGLSFGGKRKVVITSGYHFSYVQRLSKAYEDTGVTYIEPPASFTVSSLQKGWFLSLGFNFLTF
ncbi:MAG: hypothetical protein IPM42_19860 [Saprospiraceae bacterium]|nr:hypothetical protein [Saprospiraceae bacterium]